MWKNCWILRLVPVLLGLKFNILLGGGEGGGLASLWCKCCANVVVPLVTVKGQTKVALSSAYLVLGRDHSPSLCFTEPLTNSSVHIIKILHMKTSIFFPFLYVFFVFLSVSIPAGRVYSSSCDSGSVSEEKHQSLTLHPGKNT